jgi:aminopeptidase N
MFVVYVKLITYRETALLIDPKFSSMDTKQRVAIVVAHELAHQWFGNLVVCISFVIQDRF